MILALSTILPQKIEYNIRLKGSSEGRQNSFSLVVRGRVLSLRRTFRKKS